jgi:hypothetical protein
VQALAQRVPGDQLPELADDCAVLARRERVLDRELARAQPELLEAADLIRGERLIGEVVKWRAAPQRQCVARLAAGRSVIEFGSSNEALKAQRVN